ALVIEHLYAVAFINGALLTFFDVAAAAYVPSLVGRERLVEANSKLSASEAVVETTAFSIGGWVVQIFSAMVAVVVDAFSFLISGMLIWGIRKPEAAPTSGPAEGTAIREISEGLQVVWSNPLLRAVTGSTVAEGLAFGVVSATILIFGVRELGISSGVLGTIFAVGGISSFLGASWASRVTRRFGFGPAIIGGFLLFSLGLLLLPAARGPVLAAGGILVMQQFFDAAWTVFQVNQMSLRQAVTPDRLLGRANASLRFLGMGSLFLGSLLGGALAEAIGLRVTLLVAAGTALLGAAWLAFSPLRTLRELPISPKIDATD
ncbi:MAG: MFS transporter, partial [Dehalococcoidia bacterium]